MRPFLGFILFAMIPLNGLSQAAADATATQGVRLQTYVLGNYVRPHFATLGSTSGVTAGASASAFRLGPFRPSLDGRVSTSFGGTSEVFVGGGPKLSLNLGRFHPYADYLFGYGLIHFNNPSDPSYTHNNSIVTAFGGGFDYSINRSWAIRADLQRQDWGISHLTPNFYPLTVGVGIRYQFHFHSRKGPE